MTRAVWPIVVFLSLSTVSCRSTRLSLPPPSLPLVATPDEAFRRQPPRPEPRHPFVEPEVTSARLSCGLTLIVLRRPGTLLTTARYVTRRGGEDLPVSMAGRAWMVGQIMQLSAAEPGDRDDPDMAGLRVDVSVGMDQASVSIDHRVGRTDSAIARIASVVRRPRFRFDLVERARRETLERIARSRRSPERAALYWGRSMLYGLDHRMAFPLWGRASVVREVTTPELMALHHIGWGPRESALVVVGDVDFDRVRDRAEAAFDGWASDGPPREPRERWTALDSRDVARGLGLSSGAPRGVVMLVERAPGRLSRDRVAFELLTSILGGMRSSRLDMNLPQICESCSGVDAMYEPHLSGGELVISASAGPRHLDDLLEALLGEVERVVDETPDADELETARALLREHTLRRLERNDRAARLLADFFVVGAEPGALSRRVRELDAATPADVLDVARRYLRPERMPVVITGRRAATERALVRAGVAPIVFRR